MNIKTIIIIAVIHIISGSIAKAVVRGKNYPNNKNHGFAWGFFLGILGLIICLFKTPMPKRRPSSSYSSSSSSYNRNNAGTGSGYSSTPQSQRYGTYPQHKRFGDSSTNTRTVTKQNFAQKLNTLNDSGDVKVQASPQQKKMVSEAKTYRATKKRTFSAVQSGEQISIDLSWSENLAELLEATEVVYSNAELNCNRRMVSERFNYYINLHYRSFTAADLCHAKREEIMTSLNNLRKIISRLNDRSDFLRVDKASYDQLIALRSSMYDLTEYLGKRRDLLNKQTAVIREKIKNECGERGQRWYLELMERAGK